MDCRFFFGFWLVPALISPIVTAKGSAAISAYADENDLFANVMGPYRTGATSLSQQALITMLDRWLALLL